jgi:hypothetical protein
MPRDDRRDSTNELGRYDGEDYRGGAGRDAERGTDRDDNLGRADAVQPSNDDDARDTRTEWGEGYGGGYGRSGDYGEDGGRGDAGFGADAGKPPDADDDRDDNPGREGRERE